jgi:hydroxymethylpyrimidine kinase/phosphomethylpyrimidine kinase
VRAQEKTVGDPAIDIQHATPENPRTPVVWTVAGSDPGGGAGIQSDLKVLNAFGIHGCTVITALTAQNTREVTATESVSETLFRAQLDALAGDLPPAAIKTGMLGSPATCRVLAAFLATPDLAACPLVCDPVLQSSSGAALLDPEALDLLKHDIFPRVSVLTPNLPEAAHLLGDRNRSMEETAEQMLALGVRSVLIKGGHAQGDDCRDYWTDGSIAMWLSSPRIDTRATHGTGCILSAAIAAGLALGKHIPEAIIDAKSFLNQCLRSPAHLGLGHGPMRIYPYRNDPKDKPLIADPGRKLRPPSSPA